MFTGFERMLAARYLRARKGDRFASIIAVFSLIGIALGVATLIVVSSVMSGFQQELVSRVLGVNGHITVMAEPGRAIGDYQALAKRIGAIHDVISAVPVLDGQALISTPSGGAQGALVRGITAADLKSLSPFGLRIVEGSLDGFSGGDAIAVGLSIAQMDGLRVGSRVTVISPQGAATAFGTIPRVQSYKVAAVFDAGLNDYNSGVVFLPMEAAQIFFQKPASASAIEIRLSNPDLVDQVAPSLVALLAGQHLLARDWRHANDQIVGVLQVQKDTMIIVLGMIVLVAAFNVVSSLIMLVKDKRADIAVLRTLGASSGAVLRIFLMCGAFVGVAGTVLGTGIGLLVCHNIVAIQHWIEQISGGKVFDASVFQLTELPSAIDWGDVGYTVLLGLGLSLAATLYPSWRAARTDPVEALRHE